ncbi:MAG TPA: YfhO family protein [Acidobacteriota bacterium]|nr:YfhO family protein [Acidobacteriota bacterium]
MKTTTKAFLHRKLNSLRSWRRGDRLCVGLIVAANLLFFGDILFTDNTLFYRDIGGFHHPFKRLVTEAYAKGEWPLWNPYIQFGQPLLANPNTMALYPTQILFHILPFPTAFDLHLVLNCLGAGLGAFFLARSLGFSASGALVAGLAYNFNGVVISLINLPLLAATAALLPWLALFLRRMIYDPSSGNVACTSALAALALLVLEPLTGLAALLFLVPFSIHCWLNRPPGSRLRLTAAAVLIAALSSVGLAAAQLLPTIEMLLGSERRTGLNFTDASYWSVHPFTLTQMLFPAVWRDSFQLSSLSGHWSNVFFEGREAYILSCYPGLGCLVFVVLGLFFSSRRNLKWLLTGIGLSALLLALGKYTPVYSFLYDYFPLFRLGRYPSKFLLTLGLCFALLAGLGIEELPRLRSSVAGSRGKTRLVGFLLLFVVLLTIAGLIAVTWTWNQAGAVVANDTVRFTFNGAPVQVSLSAIRDAAAYLYLIVPAGITLVLIACFASRPHPSWIAGMAAALLFFDLGDNHSINPVVHVDAYRQPPVTEWLLKKCDAEELFRIHHLKSKETRYVIQGKSDSLIWHLLFCTLTASAYSGAGDHLHYSSFPPVDKLETAGSQRIYEKLQRTTALGEQLQIFGRLNTVFFLSMEPVNRPELEWQASFEVNADKPLLAYRLANALPRAFLISTGSDRKGLTLDDYLDVSRPLEDKALIRPGQVRITRYQADRVELQVEAEQAARLVLLDSYYPGWRVFVNDQPGTVARFAEVFRAVDIPAGKHQVVFFYDPNSFRYGLALTLVTVIVWICVLLALWQRKWRGRRIRPELAADAEVQLIGS